MKKLLLLGLVVAFSAQTNGCDFLGTLKQNLGLHEYTYSTFLEDVQKLHSPYNTAKEITGNYIFEYSFNEETHIWTTPKNDDYSLTKYLEAYYFVKDWAEKMLTTYYTEEDLNKNYQFQYVDNRNLYLVSNVKDEDANIDAGDLFELRFDTDGLLVYYHRSSEYLGGDKYKNYKYEYYNK